VAPVCIAIKELISLYYPDHPIQRACNGSAIMPQNDERRLLAKIAVQRYFTSRAFE
jgi:hypothetical protein